MRLSAAGLALLCRLEGCRLEVYRDAAGLPTIGVGHLLCPPSTPEVERARIMRETRPITQAEAERLLAADLAPFERAVEVHTLGLMRLPQYQYDALIIFAFNVGVQAFLRSGVLSAVRKGNFAAVPGALTLWNKITDPKTGKLVVSPGLVRRREAEARLWAQGHT